MIAVAGDSVFQDTIHFTKGWNILGGVSKPVPVTSLTEVPPGLIESPFYLYTDHYSTADTLYPGNGYWFKAGDNGSIIFSATSAKTPQLRFGKK
jgi:hypothetical protein